MRLILYPLLTALTIACSDVRAPTMPTIPSPIVGPPASITLSALAGLGNSYGQAFLTVHVQDAAGRPVGGIAVDFSTPNGAIVPSPARTDAGGQAQAVLSTSVTSVPVTAKSGDASATIDVAITLPPGPVTFPPPILTPPPPPLPPPPPPPTPPPVSVSLTCTTTTGSISVPCNVTVTENGLPATANVMNVAWDWGDGTITSPAAVFLTHNYAQVGSYSVIATVTMKDGKAGSAQQSVIVK